MRLTNCNVDLGKLDQWFGA